MASVYLSIIIPFYSERESLNELYQRLQDVLKSLSRSFEVIFVDDGSSDGSFEFLESLISNDNRFKILSFKKNFGQTAALQAGFDFASGEVIIPMDADLENDPADIPKLVQKLEEGFDIVSGWRKKRWSNKLLTRHLTSVAANLLISKVSGVRLHDFGCTLKAYRKDTIKGLRLYGEMHRFIPALASWQGARIAEIEVQYHPRKYGTSKYGLERILKVLLDLITLKFLNDYSLKPIYFFGKAGFISMALGVISFLLATYYKVTGQKDYIQTPLPVIMVLFIVVGIVMILIGLVAEMVMRMYYEAGHKPVYYIKKKKNIEDG